MWSLGISLIELSRVNPYPGRDESKLPQSMSCYEFPFEEFDGISEEMHDFLRKCLAKDVNERWGVSDLMEVNNGAGD